MIPSDHWYISTPVIIFLVIFLIGIVFYFCKFRRVGLIVGSLSILWLTLISFPFVPSILVKSLEDRFSPLLGTSQIPIIGTIYILVLGGGYSECQNLSKIEQLSLSSPGRLSEGMRLHSLMPGSHLVFSAMNRDQNYSQAEIIKKAALAMGVEEKEINLLPASENTRMEALNFTDKFGTNNTLLLVTDAVHMPRAMLLFEKAGQKPIPAPTNHMVKSDWENGVSYWLPASSNIAMMESAMHEIVGLLYARLFYRGISDEIKK